MTWTLRFYDDNGTEVAWVRTEPYEYEITHPTDMPELDETLTKLEEPTVMTLADPLEDEDGNIWRGGRERYEFISLRDQPGHLEYIQDDVTHHAIDSSELNDE